MCMNAKSMLVLGSFKARLVVLLDRSLSPTAWRMAPDMHRFWEGPPKPRRFLNTWSASRIRPSTIFSWVNNTWARGQVHARHPVMTACGISAICPTTASSTGASDWISLGLLWTLRPRLISPFHTGRGSMSLPQPLILPRCQAGNGLRLVDCRRVVGITKLRSLHTLYGIVSLSVSGRCSQPLTHKRLPQGASRYGSNRFSISCGGRFDYIGSASRQTDHRSQCGGYTPPGARSTRRWRPVRSSRRRR